MILVTVGSTPYSFSRLLVAIDNLIIQHKIKEEVIIQTGYTEFESDNCQCFDFLDMSKFEELIQQSKLVITHAGVGTIMTLLKYGKPIIAVPRLQKLHENVDNHQLELTKELSRQGKVILVYEISDLEKAIEIAKDFRPKNSVVAKKDIIETIESYCRKIDNR